MTDRIVINLTRFIISGTFSAFIYSVGFVELSKLGISPWICGAASYAGTMPIAYTLHRKYSFKSQKPVTKEVLRFTAGSLIGLISASVTPSALARTTSMSHEWIALWTSVLTPCITYLIMSFWVFKES